MSTYRGYIRILAGDDGKPLGKVGLKPVVENLNAHAIERMREDYIAVSWLRPFSVVSHLGRPTILMEVYEAWQVRSCRKAMLTFLNATGWKWTVDWNANTRRAI